MGNVKWRYAQMEYKNVLDVFFYCEGFGTITWISRE